MYGKHSMSRRQTPAQLKRTLKPRVPSTDAPTRLDIGDWSLAQDDDGSLIIHNVVTGSRVVLSRAE